jgi:REP element-mobilizing transposase RayT
MPGLLIRKQIRLKNYDYALSGYYFVTICAKNRENIFGAHVGANGCWPDDGIKIKLNEFGLVVDEELKNTNNINRKQTLSSFVSGFKSVATKRINILRNTPERPVWQRSFYDHIIRNERSLNAIREYISNNPVNWEMDIDNLLNND